MSKYSPLAEFLARHSGHIVPMSFKDIEKALGFKLPPSAYSQRAWWSNNVNNNVMTRVWKRAGFLTRNVDMKKQTVEFESLKRPYGDIADEAHQKFQANKAKRQAQKRGHAKVHPLRGALKGSLRLVGGTDLTKPVDAAWGDT